MFTKEKPESTASIYMCSSCAKAEPGMPTIPNESVQTCPVLLRRNTDLDNLDNSYKNGLELKRFPFPPLGPTTKENKACSLQWRRGQDFGQKTWSKNFRNRTEVVGSLEASLPFLLTRGKYLCTEVGGLASDDVWEELLGRKG